MTHEEKAFDIARQVRKLVLATVEVHDHMEHRLELEESLYRALASYLCQQQATLARAFLDAAITTGSCASTAPRRKRNNQARRPIEKSPGTISAEGFFYIPRAGKAISVTVVTALAAGLPLICQYGNRENGHESAASRCRLRHSDNFHLSGFCCRAARLSES